jgi:hypothetical protein
MSDLRKEIEAAINKTSAETAVILQIGFLRIT